MGQSKVFLYYFCTRLTHITVCVLVGGGGEGRKLQGSLPYFTCYWIVWKCILLCISQVVFSYHTINF